ncbi:MAG: VCBS repeat-containing protein [Verrucomicrobiota bacterium]
MILLPRGAIVRMLVWAAMVTAACLSMPAARNVAGPNLLWHNKSTGATRLWLMSGADVAGEESLPATADDPAWKPAGIGDLNRDGEPDVIWQNERTGYNAVWYMKGLRMSANALLPSAGDLSWKIVAVADFNRDGRPDLLWQNVSYGFQAIWLMDNAKMLESVPLVPLWDANWRMVGAADVNRDGSPDIIVRHQKTGQNGVWFMKGTAIKSGERLKMSNGNDAIEADLDWQIVGTFDLNGDSKPDLVWRHATLGLNVCWYLDKTTVIGTAKLARNEFDLDWRICSQDTADSNWRLQKAEFTWARAKAAIAPPQVFLSFKLPPNPPFGATIQRRLRPSTNWTTLTTAWKENSYTDTNVVAGRAYDYRVWREAIGGGRHSASEHVSVGLDLPPIEDRGRVLVLVDQTLAARLNPSLQQLEQDLVGDGWKVLRQDVPRHIDDYTSPMAYRTNAYNITQIIKPLIQSAVAEDPSTKAIFIVGHVSIPYSGTFNPDGHTCGPAPFGPDHRGAWPADMFYGDLLGTWTDQSGNLMNCDFPECHNVPGDGRFDQDGIPLPSVMQLCVGRVDFARMPVFTEQPPPGQARQTEVGLIEQYLRKDHLYRHRQLPWQQGDRPLGAMVYAHFEDARANPILENACHAAFAIGQDLGCMTVSDFCLNRARPALWGFMAGPGGSDRINSGIPVLEHTSADLVPAAHEPKAAFFTLHASYVGDWNMVGNNYLRALLATPNFGLASMWTRFGLWRTDILSLGEHLGACHLEMVNNPKNIFYDQSRDLTVLGDPTLRLHLLPPPRSLKATRLPQQVQLAWSPAQPDCQYYVYASPSGNGPYTRLSDGLLTEPSFRDQAPGAAKKVYMVRALQRVAVGTGSYTNISQGVRAPVD